ncbi:hypothetical protein G6O69_18490 [Pseudenhygromyxa sp. WMMC2535]|uniref:hypothetical protein n=1 Tax=Pseudenhygromyxa sp. WMMC2535 TaxID=2712867 RepID=UPI001554F3AF|nr:hypothetical protein [Pseudenhygromyxa sp. WMMC2535]NVB39838.1 hypothetical protein [Pseudenhygromyxa sp. WMMC2535]
MNAPFRYFWLRDEGLVYLDGSNSTARSGRLEVVAGGRSECVHEFERRRSLLVTSPGTDTFSLTWTSLTGEVIERAEFSRAVCVAFERDSWTGSWQHASRLEIEFSSSSEIAQAPQFASLRRRKPEQLHFSLLDLSPSAALDSALIAPRDGSARWGPAVQLRRSTACSASPVRVETMSSPDRSALRITVDAPRGARVRLWAYQGYAKVINAVRELTNGASTTVEIESRGGVFVATDAPRGVSMSGSLVEVDGHTLAWIGVHEWRTLSDPPRDAIEALTQNPEFPVYPARDPARDRWRQRFPESTEFVDSLPQSDLDRLDGLPTGVGKLVFERAWRWQQMDSDVPFVTALAPDSAVDASMSAPEAIDILVRRPGLAPLVRDFWPSDAPPPAPSEVIARVAGAPEAASWLRGWPAQIDQWIDLHNGGVPLDEVDRVLRVHAIASRPDQIRAVASALRQLTAPHLQFEPARFVRDSQLARDCQAFLAARSEIASGRATAARVLQARDLGVELQRSLCQHIDEVIAARGPDWQRLQSCLRAASGERYVALDELERLEREFTDERSRLGATTQTPPPSPQLTIDELMCLQLDRARRDHHARLRQLVENLERELGVDRATNEFINRGERWYAALSRRGFETEFDAGVQRTRDFAAELASLLRDGRRWQTQPEVAELACCVESWRDLLVEHRDAVATMLVAGRIRQTILARIEDTRRRLTSLGAAPLSYAAQSTDLDLLVRDLTRVERELARVERDVATWRRALAQLPAEVATELRLPNDDIEGASAAILDRAQPIIDVLASEREQSELTCSELCRWLERDAPLDIELELDEHLDAATVELAAAGFAQLVALVRALRRYDAWGKWQARLFAEARERLLARFERHSENFVALRDYEARVLESLEAPDFDVLSRLASTIDELLELVRDHNRMFRPLQSPPVAKLLWLIPGDPRCQALAVVERLTRDHIALFEDAALRAQARTAIDAANEVVKHYGRSSTTLAALWSNLFELLRATFRQRVERLRAALEREDQLGQIHWTDGELATLMSLLAQVGVDRLGPTGPPNSSTNVAMLRPAEAQRLHDLLVEFDLHPAPEDAT